MTVATIEFFLAILIASGLSGGVGYILWGWTAAAVIGGMTFLVLAQMRGVHGADGSGG